MGQFGIGQSVLRVEDDRFITGQGEYTDDLEIAGALSAFAVRSPYAHARIGPIDAEAALASDGVHAVFTAKDLEGRAGVIPCLAPLKNKDGSPLVQTPRPLLVGDTARFVGDLVAFVIADTVEQARDAAELLEIDYKPLDAVATMDEATADGAPVIWDQLGGNVGYDWEAGDKATVDQAFSGAAHIAKVRVVNNRVAPSAMEPRAAVASFDAESGYTLYCGSQGVAGMRNLICAATEIPPDRIRIVTRDVGGGFGMKGFLYPEYVLCMLAAETIGRPVKWTGDRADSFQGDTHGRDVVSDVELALDEDARILALRIANRTNAGAYHSSFGPYIQTFAPYDVLGGLYRVPALHVITQGIITNTMPVDAYRGAGRPEAAYIVERVLNQAALDLGLGQDEIRRRNFIPADAMPYTNAVGAVYDSGDPTGAMEHAMQAADWEGFVARRSAAEASGRLAGIGIGYYVERTGASPFESTTVTFAGGYADIHAGTLSNGQGHETTFPQVLSDLLAIPYEQIRYVQGDTADKDDGGGTGGSRSLQMVAGALEETAQAVVAKGRQAAALIAGASEEDVSFIDGHFRIAGTNEVFTVLELAEKARELDSPPEGLEDGLDSTGTYKMPALTFPNGCHIAEVEIDPDTGWVTVVRYTVTDDFGNLINPMVVEGQVQGGVVQGLGQVLMEDMLYEEGSGQLLTGSFMDYAMPRAGDMVDIAFSTRNVPCTTSALGVKGCGEAGTVGALAAITNAVIDALRPRGIDHVDMPATPQRIWRLLNPSSAA